MSQLTASQLFAAAVFLFTAMVWAIIAADLWSFRLRLRPHSAVSKLLPWLCSAVAIFFVVEVVESLIPPAVHAAGPRALQVLHLLADTLIVGALAMTRHLAMLMPPGVPPPSRRWLLGHYGLAVAVVLLTVFTAMLPNVATRSMAVHAVHFVYIIAMLVLSVAHVARFARRGAWRPGSLGDLRTADIVALVAGVITAVLLFIVLLARGDLSWSNSSVVVLNVASALLLAVPFAVRVLGLLVRELSVMTANLAVAAATFWLAALLTAHYGSAPGSVVQLGAVFLPVLLLIPLQGPLRRAVNQLLFHRRHRRYAELQATLMRLSPELGVAECCRRGLDEFVRVMQLRGAGILFESDGTAIAVGEIDLAPLQRVWPRGRAAEALPTDVFSGGVFRELPTALQEALIESEIVGVTPIISPRRRWGCGFVTTGVLRASFTSGELEAVQAVAGQFALLLDAAELLERAVSVERSLAHSEKLAAVGELAARVAHEIRNPVTAARSLAQLMVSDPTSPHAAEHAELILAELGRVERQVQALLRFARREEFSFESVDLGKVVSAALEPLRPRLESGGVTVRTEIADGVVARADREKLRQVVTNLLDNAVDAVGAAHEKEVVLAVHSVDGSAVLEVRDSGPGVPVEILPRLFEPFFSLKTTGTGLGLAIVKRTVEAHGGRVEARSDAGSGLLLRVELPAAVLAGVA